MCSKEKKSCSKGDPMLKAQNRLLDALSCFSDSESREDENSEGKNSFKKKTDIGFLEDDFDSVQSLDNSSEKLSSLPVSPSDCDIVDSGKILDHPENNDIFESETNRVLLKHNCKRLPFPDGCKKYYPDPLTFHIPLSEYVVRNDLRNLCTFTIDPSNASDLDDALSVNVLENGNYEIGVHIADVSYFFEPNTSFDDIVKANAMTIYLPHKVLHMLPEDLVSLCSLKPGVDRLVFSVFWEFNRVGTIVSTRYARSVVNSCAQFSYDNIQNIIEERNSNDIEQLKNFPEIFNGFTLDNCIKNINILFEFSNILLSKRLSHGCVNTDKPKIEFVLDSNTNIPIELKVDRKRECNGIVEEFMILANCTVAKTLFDTYPDLCIFRYHKAPNQAVLCKTKEILSHYGLNVEFNSPADVYKMFQQTNNEVLRLLTSKKVVSSFKRAKFGCSKPREKLQHFALNSPYYTFFTSPIRRYADIIVHRFLSAALGYTALPNWSIDYIKSITKKINDISLSITQVGERMDQFFLMQHVRHHGPLLLKCIVIGLSELHIDVISVEYKFQFRVLMDLMDRNSVNEVITDWISDTVSTITVLWKDDCPQKISFASEIYVHLFVSMLQVVQGCLISPNTKAYFFHISS